MEALAFDSRAEIWRNISSLWFYRPCEIDKETDLLFRSRFPWVYGIFQLTMKKIWLLTKSSLPCSTIMNLKADINGVKQCPQVGTNVWKHCEWLKLNWKKVKKSSITTDRKKNYWKHLFRMIKFWFAKAECLDICIYCISSKKHPCTPRPPKKVPTLEAWVLIHGNIVP